MKVVTWNVNGVRSVYGKGFDAWFRDEAADIVCVQEIKARPEQLSEELLHPDGYHSFWHPASIAGYSGVAIYARKDPLAVRSGLGIAEIDREGRVIELDFKHGTSEVTLVNAYFPNSQRDHARLPYKVAFCRHLFKRVEELRSNGRTVLVCGDFNIAHREIDLRNPKQNLKNAGFLPEEREWMESFVQSGWVDAFRHFESGPEHYTWWSYRPGIRERNIGWRLDYFFTNDESKDRLKKVEHRPHIEGSDHCPVVLRLR